MVLCPFVTILILEAAAHGAFVFDLLLQRGLEVPGLPDKCLDDVLQHMKVKIRKDPRRLRGPVRSGALVGCLAVTGLRQHMISEAKPPAQYLFRPVLQLAPATCIC